MTSHPSITRSPPFFTTRPEPCPYREGRIERRIVTELRRADAKGLNNALSRIGFRRSHSFAYAPACADCSACIPVRVAAAAFSPSRTFRRIIAKNADLRLALLPPRATFEHYRLFQLYQDRRHPGDLMAAMPYCAYQRMIEDSPIETHLAEFRTPDGALVAACLFDMLDDGASAVYAYYDPFLAHRSLGTFAILQLIEECRRRGLAYLYLGYWVGESRKMSYKSRFAPLEAYRQTVWEPF